MTDDIHTLRESFGYEPDRNCEQFTIYQPPGEPADRRVLIVIHPERKPRIYNLRCPGVAIEFDPVYV